MLDLDEHTITDAVAQTLSGPGNDRARELLIGLIRHLHAYVREVRLTEQEWFTAVDFLTRAGAMCTEARQELILLSDVLGVTMLVDAVNNTRNPESTANSVLGPFFSENRPALANGADISDGLPGTPLLFQGRVVDPDGNPIAGAAVDVWHSDADGHYDVDIPGRAGPAMRAGFRTDDAGGFAFRSVAPMSYPIPGDGPVGELMRATDRSLMRPAHIHVRISARGFQRLTTMLFRAGDPYLDADPVFGTKQSLVADFEQRDAATSPAEVNSGPYTFVGHTFVLEPTGP